MRFADDCNQQRGGGNDDGCALHRGAFTRRRIFDKGLRAVAPAHASLRVATRACTSWNAAPAHLGMLRVPVRLSRQSYGPGVCITPVWPMRGSNVHVRELYGFNAPPLPTVWISPFRVVLNVSRAWLSGARRCADDDNPSRERRASRNDAPFARRRRPRARSGATVRGVMSTILISGGAGYIGSHAAYVLKTKGHQPVIVDNLATGNAWATAFGNLRAGRHRRCGLRARGVRQAPACCSAPFCRLYRSRRIVQNPAKYFENNRDKASRFFQTLSGSGSRRPRFPAPPPSTAR